MWNYRNGLAAFRFSWEAPVWSLTPTNKGTSRREEEHSLYPIGMPTVCWKTRPPKITNMLSIKNTNMLMMSVSGNFSQNKIYPFLEQDLCIYVEQRNSHFKTFNSAQSRCCAACEGFLFMNNLQKVVSCRNFICEILIYHLPYLFTYHYSFPTHNQYKCLRLQQNPPISSTILLLRYSRFGSHVVFQK